MASSLYSIGLIECLKEGSQFPLRISELTAALFTMPIDEEIC